jgi:4-diphosphocytidyl-2-C-methyl-D-erythritol kinase
MNSIELDSRAKINLSIDVLRKRSDGYHDVKMIMQEIELHDTVIVETADSGIQLECGCKWVPSGEKNTAYKAARLLFDRFNIKAGVRIRLIKRIPVSAGLAGGSSNAAAVLKGINRLFSLGLDQTELLNTGRNIGADVPFCILGGTALAEGIGDALTELEPFPPVSLVLVKPKIGVSTQWVYRNLRLNEITDRPDTDLLISAIRQKRPDIVAENMVNVLETVTAKRFKIIREIEEKFMEHGALGSMMSGSGPTVFGIFGNRISAENAYEVLKSSRWDTILTETIREGGTV